MCLGNKLAVISVAFRDEAARNSINNAARAPDGPDVRSPRADIPGPVGIEQPDVTLFRLSMSVNTVRAVIDTGQPVASMGNRGNGSIIFFASVPELKKSLAQTLARGKSRVNTDCLGVTSRQVVRLFFEQLWFEFVPVFHGLQGRLAAQG